MNNLFFTNLNPNQNFLFTPTNANEFSTRSAIRAVDTSTIIYPSDVHLDDKQTYFVENSSIPSTFGPEKLILNAHHSQTDECVNQLLPNEKTSIQFAANIYVSLKLQSNKNWTLKWIKVLAIIRLMSPKPCWKKIASKLNATVSTTFSDSHCQIRWAAIYKENQHLHKAIEELAAYQLKEKAKKRQLAIDCINNATESLSPQLIVNALDVKDGNGWSKKMIKHLVLICLNFSTLSWHEIALVLNKIYIKYLSGTNCETKWLKTIHDNPILLKYIKNIAIMRSKKEKELNNQTVLSLPLSIDKSKDHSNVTLSIWNNSHSSHVHQLIQNSDDKINWEEIANLVNQKFATSFTADECFFNYQLEI